MYKFQKLISLVTCSVLTTLVLGSYAQAEQVYSTKDLGYGIDYAENHYFQKLASTAPSNYLDKDFSILSSHFNTIRTYSISLFGTYRVLREAQRYKTGVVLGLGWSYENSAEFQTQFELFKQLFHSYPELQSSVKAIIVGNEVYDEAMANDPQGIQKWINDVNQVRNWVNKNWSVSPLPFVTVSERADVLEGTAKVPGSSMPVGQAIVTGLPAGTPVFANIYPFWGGCTIDMAVNPNLSTSSGGDPTRLKECLESNGSLQQRWDTLTSTISNYSGSHPVILGETGWPTGGPAGKIPGTNSPTVTPSLADAQKYWNYIYGKGSYSGNSDAFVIKNSGVTIFAFSGFDEPIKGKPGDVDDLDHHWGFYDWRDNSKDIAVPLNQSIAPSTATGTYVNFSIIGEKAGSPVDWSKYVTVSVDGKIYPYKALEDGQIAWDAYSMLGISGYPWIPYNEKITVEYNDKEAGGTIDVKCTNTLLSGDGIAGVLSGLTPDSTDEPDLEFSSSKSPGWCQFVGWKKSGVVLPQESPASNDKVKFIIMNKSKATYTFTVDGASKGAIRNGQVETLKDGDKVSIQSSLLQKPCANTITSGKWSSTGDDSCQFNWQNQGNAGQETASVWLP